MLLAGDHSLVLSEAGSPDFGRAQQAASTATQVSLTWQSLVLDSVLLE